MDMDREDIISGMFNLLMDRPDNGFLDALEHEQERAARIYKRERRAYEMQEMGLDEEEWP